MSEPRSEGSSPGGEGGGDEEARLRRERMRSEQRKQREKVSPGCTLNIEAFIVI